MPLRAVNAGKYRLYSRRWGVLRSKDSPLPFADEWERLSEAVKASSLSREARKRYSWFEWHERRGNGNVRATCRHFGIAPKVFYFWRRRFVTMNIAALEDKSHQPHRPRSSTLTGIQIERIVELRREYIHYSKMKLAILYRGRHAEKVSSWKIQQVIQRFRLYPNPVRAENTAKKRRRAWKKKRITELSTKPAPGFLFGIDTVVRHFKAEKRYILTAVDRFSRFAYARMYTTHSSANAADFLRRLHRLCGGQLTHIQTDNGSEFHLHFEKAIRDLKLQHWWSRVKTPKDNAVCERFNRTLQYEFIACGNAIPNAEKFNQKLTEWLIEYDFHRSHAALGYKRPIEVASLQGEKALPINPSLTRHCAECHAAGSLDLLLAYGLAGFLRRVFRQHRTLQTARENVMAKNNRSDSAPQHPEKKFGPFHGGVGVAIWLNDVETEEGTRYFRSVSIAPRRFRDKDTGDWKDAASLRLTDLPALVLALEAAQAYIANTPLPGEPAEEDAEEDSAIPE